MAASSAPTSAAAVAKILSGTKFPKNKKQLVKYAEQHKDKLSKPGAIIEALRELNDTRFENMADVEKALGEIR